MLRNHYESDHEQFRTAFRGFLDKEVLPHSKRFREQGLIDREVYSKAGESGFLCYFIPEAYGGLGLEDLRYDQLMYEEVTHAHETSLMIGSLNRNAPPYILKYGTEEQKRHFLPKLTTGEAICGIAMTEPGAGSDIGGFKTRVDRRSDGTWVLNGQKTYISFGIIADMFVVAAKTDPKNPRQIGLFIVERDMPGFRSGRRLDKLGYRAQDTSELFFEDVELTPLHVIGDPASGFDYMRKGLAEERIASAVQGLPFASEALRLAIDFTTERKAFGQRISDFQNTKFKLAEMQTEILAAQAFTDHCVQLFNAGQLDPATAAACKLKCSEVQAMAVDQSLQLHGSAGFMWEYPICQLYADSRISRIFAGTSEIMK